MSNAATALPLPVVPMVASVSSSSHGTIGLNDRDYIQDGTMLKYQAPDCFLTCLDPKAIVSPVGPSATSNNDSCAICCDSLLEVFSENLAQLAACGHVFHRSYLLESIKHDQKCPICRVTFGEPQGSSPSGSLTVKFLSQPCPGLSQQGFIQLSYVMPQGVQKSYHPSPGTVFQQTMRNAYLPWNDDGLLLLERLAFAFLHGLTFTVGTSQTTGQKNVITWSCIHHKTSLNGGAHQHGFRDENFLSNCNYELDILGVPAGIECLRRRREPSTIPFVAPEKLPLCSVAHTASRVLFSRGRQKCQLCAVRSKDHMVSSRCCGKLFHSQCWAEHMASTLFCPKCHTRATPKGVGTCPSGKLTITTDPRSLPGHENYRTIVVCYKIEGGI